MKTLLRIVKVVLILGAFSIVGLYLSLWIMFDRTREFRAQAILGQPIVRAIEQYQTDVGQLPPSITNLVPKYLPRVPDLADFQANKLKGWNYTTETKGSNTTYTLTYYMGRGGVVYVPPNWYGNDEGHRTVILRNP